MRGIGVHSLYGHSDSSRGAPRNRMGSVFFAPIAPPDELLNEPFSDTDNGLRPELIVSRPSFHFCIAPDGCPPGLRCLVGHSVLSREDTRAAPKKSDSFCSVLSVYDTYGLDITLEYLRYLEYVKAFESADWTELYLIGSLKLMGVVPVTSRIFTANVQVLCRQLRGELEKLDSSSRLQSSSRSRYWPR